MEGEKVLKIVIADDENGIIDLIKALISYPGAEIVGEARDGIELVQQVERLHPNTVITDINMPGLTGLEAVAEMKEKYPDVRFIIMSGYSEFSYAQESIRLKVQDYLLKPINKEELNMTLEKIDRLIYQESLGQEELKLLRVSLKKSEDQIRSKFLLDAWQAMLNGTYSTDRIKENLAFVDEDINIDFSGRKGFLVLINRDGRGSIGGSFQTSGMDMMDEFASLIEMFDKKSSESVMTARENQVLIMILSEADHIDELFRGIQRELRGRIEKDNLRHNFHRITASMSDVSNIDMMHFPKLIQEVQRALTYRIEMPQVAVHIYNMKFEIEIEKRISLRQLEYSEKLRDAIRDMDMEAAAESIRRIWQRLTSHINTPGNTWTVFSDLLDIVNTEMGKKESAERISAEFQTNPEQLVRLDIDYSNLQQQLVDYMFALFERYRESMDNRQNPSITRAKEYVMRHYSETITLDDVAKAACLSSSYFSTLFKTETGVGFTDYIQQVRIDKAKSLLKETSMRVQDIAESVGYRDIKSFNKVFIRLTKVKPSEYRKYYAE
jgi:two-component system response regulator YesN